MDSQRPLACPRNGKISPYTPSGFPNDLYRSSDPAVYAQKPLPVPKTAENKYLHTPLDSLLIYLDLQSQLWILRGLLPVTGVEK